MMVKKYILIVFFTSIFSFGQKCSDVEVLKGCINDKVNKAALELYGKASFDTYEFLKVIENEILKHKLLSNVRQQDYKVFYSNIITNKRRKHKRLYRRLEILCDDTGFDYKFFSVVQAILTECPYRVFFIDNKTKHPFMKKHILTLNRLEAHGYENEELFNDLLYNIDKENFKKIAYRAPIILLVMINLDKQYNPYLKRHRKSIKGKNRPF